MNFDDKAKDWDKDIKKVIRAEIFANELKSFFKNAEFKNTFEFGCGTGLVSYYLKDCFEKITLADNSQGMIDVLKEKIKKENLNNMHPLFIDLLHEKPDIEKQDLIYTFMSIHHVLDLDKILKVFNSLLKMHGYLCIADLDEEDGSFHDKHPGFTGHFGFSREKMHALYENNGFEVVEYKIFHIINKVLDTGIKDFPLFMMVGKKLKEL
jgi:predicted TPR repeat methyltransferase